MLHVSIVRLGVERTFREISGVERGRRYLTATTMHHTVRSAMPTSSTTWDLNQEVNVLPIVFTLQNISCPTPVSYSRSREENKEESSC